MPTPFDHTPEPWLAAIERDGQIEYLDDQKIFSPGDRLAPRFWFAISVAQDRTPGAEFMTFLV